MIYPSSEILGDYSCYHARTNWAAQGQATLTFGAPERPRREREREGVRERESVGDAIYYYLDRRPDRGWHREGWSLSGKGRSLGWLVVLFRALRVLAGRGGMKKSLSFEPVVVTSCLEDEQKASFGVSLVARFS